MEISKRMQSYTIDFKNDLILTRSTYVRHTAQAIKIINVDRVMLSSGSIKQRIVTTFKVLQYIWLSGWRK